MSIPRRYSSSADFRRALEARLKTIAVREQTDLQRLRRQLAFDRFLCRLFLADPNSWLLKGGYAMELRISQARSTKDIDLTFRRQLGETSSANTADVLLDNLQQTASTDLQDGPFALHETAFRAALRGGKGALPASCGSDSLSSWARQ